jgi:2-phospho-L-lactate guanylyltransferase
MRVVVPFDERRPKTRLSPVLEESERAAFARAMLGDVLAAVGAAAGRADTPTVDTVTLLSTASLPPPTTLVETDDDDGEVTATVPTEVVVDERPLTPAVNDVLAAPEEAGAWTPVAVVMADLALATPAAVAGLLRDGAEVSGRRPVTLVPGRGGGTNALLARHPEFRVDYHGLSFRDHRQRVRAADAALRRVDSYRLSTDVDEPADLPEVLLHGGARSRAWLRRAGFRLRVQEGRVEAVRE